MDGPGVRGNFLSKSFCWPFCCLESVLRKGGGDGGE